MFSASEPGDGRGGRRKRLRMVPQQEAAAAQSGKQGTGEREQQAETHVLLRSWGATCHAVLLPHGEEAA